MSFDPSEFEKYSPEQNPTDLKTLKEKALEVVELQSALDDLDVQMKEIAARKREIEEREIPAIMAELGIPEFKSSDGLKITLKEIISGTMKKVPDYDFAKSWVIENGGKDLIKTEVSVSFGVGGHNEALCLKAEIENLGHNVDLDEGINPQTYCAFIREKKVEYNEALERGYDVEEIPFDRLGIYNAKKASVNFSKKKGK